MDSDDIEAMEGENVEVEWQDELIGRQVLMGVLVGEDEYGYINLGNGIGVHKHAPGLGIRVIEQVE